MIGPPVNTKHKFFKQSHAYFVPRKGLCFEISQRKGWLFAPSFSVPGASCRQELSFGDIMVFGEGESKQSWTICGVEWHLITASRFTGTQLLVAKIARQGATMSLSNLRHFTPQQLLVHRPTWLPVSLEVAFEGKEVSLMEEVLAHLKSDPSLVECMPPPKVLLFFLFIKFSSQNT